MLSKILIRSAKNLPPCLGLQCRWSFASNKTPFQSDKSSKTPFATKNQANSWQKKLKTSDPINPFTPPTTQQQVQNSKEVKPMVDPMPLRFGNYTSEAKYDLPSEPIAEEKPQTTEQFVNSKLGLNQFLTRIYRTTGASLLLTLASAYAATTIPGLAEAGEVFIMGGGIVSFVCFQKAQSIAPTVYQDEINGERFLRTTNSPFRLFVYGIGCIAMGVSASPFFLAVQDVSSTVIPLTMGITAAIFGGSSLIGMALPKGSMLGYGPLFLGGMLGLIGLNLAGIIAAKYLAFPLFASVLATVETYAAIGIFSLMIIYDTHIAIKRYEIGDADHLGVSIQILLDVWNLIIRIMSTIAKEKLRQEKERLEKQKQDKDNTNNNTK